MNKPLKNMMKTVSFSQNSTPEYGSESRYCFNNIQQKFTYLSDMNPAKGMPIN